jgi:hypothetical protein
MVIFLNGTFGIGKSTVARHVRHAESAVFDPETACRGGTDDLQDLPAWRRFSVRGIRLVRWRYETVIVPMAFTNQ